MYFITIFRSKKVFANNAIQSNLALIKIIKENSLDLLQGLKSLKLFVNEFRFVMK